MFNQVVSRVFSTSLRACRPFSSSFSVRSSSTDYSIVSDGFLVEPKEQILWIKFNRPQKFNAITGQMYKDLTKLFTTVNKDSSIKALVLTGNGEFYSSGNDLTNFTVAMKDPEGPRAGLTKSSHILVDFVNSLICLEKFIIAAVNGPAIGIPVTTLPLCDYVIASDKATFQTPFTALGQCPEACSSVTFPQVLGRANASELLLLNMTWDAHKAQRNGLVADVVEHDKFHQQLERLVGLIGKTCYPHSMKICKSLIQNDEVKNSLISTNQKECAAILELWCGPECMDAVQKFFNRTKG